MPCGPFGGGCAPFTPLGSGTEQLFTWLSLVVSLMVDVLDEIWDLIESVSEGFLTYSFIPASTSTPSKKGLRP